MAKELHKEPFSLVRYKFHSFKITCPGLDEPWQVSADYIHRLAIEHDYEAAYFPYFAVTIQIPGWVHREMKKAVGNIDIIVDFRKGYTSSNPAHIGVGKEVVWQKYISGTFTPIFETSGPDNREDMDIGAEKYDKSYKQGMSFYSNVTMDLLLYRKDYLAGSKKTPNDILTSATLVDALTYTMNKAGLGGALISPPSNNPSKSEFVITPLTAMNQMNRICNYYGMHKNGTLIYFGFDYLYILSKEERCTAWVNNEYKQTKIFYMTKTQGSQQRQSGCNTDAETKTNGMFIADLSAEDKTQQTNQLFGSGVTVIDTYATSTTSAGNNTASQVMVATGGANRSGAIGQSINAAKKIVTCSAQYIDLSFLEPNKEIVLYIDDNKYKEFNVKYRVTKVTTMFEPESHMFNPKCVFELRSSL